MQDIAATNLLRSPLLRLPPELRLQIYTLALGGNSYHIVDGPINRSDSGPVSMKRCVARLSDEAAVSLMPSVLETNEDYAYQSIYRHVWCTHVTSKRPRQQSPVGLLFVCRQIYQESCLILLEESEFIFQRLPALEQFLGNLTSKQRKSVRTIRLSCLLSALQWDTGLDPSIIRMLSGLRRLTVFLEVRPGAVMRLRSDQSTDYKNFLTESARNRAVAGLGSFALLQLQTLEVLLCQAVLKIDARSGARLSDCERTAWARGIAELIQPTQAVVEKRADVVIVT